MDAVTSALYHAAPRRRVELLDAAAAAARHLRLCGLDRCPPDCVACTRAMARGVVWLSHLPELPVLEATCEPPAPTLKPVVGWAGLAQARAKRGAAEGAPSNRPMLGDS